jgi:hypothetical protein
MNDLDLVRAVVADLREAGFEAWLFGGWAEEALTLSDPRPHSDVDVMLISPSVSALDSFVKARGEVVDGHLSHKRVYDHNGVKVELFISQWNGDRLETVFWDRLSWYWPKDMRPVMFGELPVAPVAALASFRDSFADFMAARDSCRLSARNRGDS